MTRSVITPFRFKQLNDELLVTNEVGEFDFIPNETLDRFFSKELTETEQKKFDDLSISISDDEHWKLYSLLNRASQTKTADRKIGYIIVIPTLRCDLSCTYCQVSRAPVNAKGYDWDDEKLKAFEIFIESLDLDHAKIEFQGGEPSLRTDLLLKIIEITKRHSTTSDFVICSNLTNISPEFKQLLERDDFIVSSSIDGPVSSMSTNRTFDDEISQKIFDNFRWIQKTYGYEKVSALPTITEDQIDDPKKIIDVYLELGFESIFLRPVNYMGFARKRHKTLAQQSESWNKFYLEALEQIKQANSKQYFEEFYLAMIVRRIFSGEHEGFVDFRSPSNFTGDYVVVDFDGRLYPSDEARMLSRIGHVDLAVGTLQDGFDEPKIDQLNAGAIHQVEPDCIHCPYMPYCGIDIIDDISRYKRSDVIKKDSWFCSRQTFLFDFVFDKVQRGDREWLDIFLRWMERDTNHSQAYEIFK